MLSRWPAYGKDVLAEVNKILLSGKVNYWTGNEGKSFEKEFAAYHDLPYSIAVANGSLSLSAAYRSLGLSVGDEIITTPRTFIATASEAVLLGLKVVFADVDLDSGCITSKTIEKVITKRTKAISVVHLGGWPADMESICALANEYNLLVVEDCAQAHGAKINGKPVGSFGDIASWSFCQDKIMTTGGEGGMIATKSKTFYDFIWSFKDHGKSLETLSKPNLTLGYRWLHESFGTNFRLTEMQSAIGRKQLKNLDLWKKIRTNNASILIDALSNLDVIRVPLPPEGFEHAWYKFNCFLVKGNLRNGWNRDKIVGEIQAAGYPAFYGGCGEVYLEKAFRNAGGYHSIALPNAKELFETNLMFLVHPTISPEEMKLYSNVIKDVLKKASD